MYTHEDVITPIVMYSKVSTPEAIEFRSKLKVNPYDRPLSKEQSVISKITKLFAREKMLPQHSETIKLIYIFPSIN